MDFRAMSSKINYFSRTAKNLTKEGIFAPSNAMRTLGILTRRVFTGPLKVMISITNNCDMHCVMCGYHSLYLSKKTRQIQQISLEKFSELIKELKKIRTSTVVITAEGEPFMHPDILKLIEEVRNNSLEVEIMTNAYYLNKEKIKFLIDVGVKKLIVGLHCAEVKTFQKIRPLKNEQDFRKIIDNLYLIKALRRNNRPALFISNVISGLNYNNISEMFNLAKKVDADKIIFKPVCLTPEPTMDYVPPENEAFKDVLRVCASQIDIPNDISEFDIPNNLRGYLKSIKYGEKIIAGTSVKTIHDNKPKKSLNLCYIPWVNSAIASSGNVLGCVYSHANSLGEIYKSSFVDIWFGEKYNSFRKGAYCPQRCLGRVVYPLLF